MVFLVCFAENDLEFPVPNSVLTRSESPMRNEIIYSFGSGVHHPSVDTAQGGGMVFPFLGVYSSSAPSGSSTLSSPPGESVLPISLFHNTLSRLLFLHPQKKRHQRKTRMIKPSAPKGPYCLSIRSQLILTAALRYFLLSSRRRELISPMRSRLSPR